MAMAIAVAMTKAMAMAMVMAMPMSAVSKRVLVRGVLAKRRLVTKRVPSVQYLTILQPAFKSCFSLIIWQSFGPQSLQKRAE